MDWRKQIHRLQVDVTSYCNARCAGCSRNISGGEKQPWLKLNHFDIDVWNRLAEVDTHGWVINELKLNGTWGDAGMHPKLPEMMYTFCAAHPETAIRICTNGGTHNEAWWAKLGKALSERADAHVVDFAIDGLSDTHSIYRRSTSFEKVIANARAFAAAGGNARWIMTLFDHNIHQIEDAQKLAAECGFGSYGARYSILRNGRVMTPDEDYVIKTDIAEATPLPEFVSFTAQADIIARKMFSAVSDKMSDSLCPWYNSGLLQIDPWSRIWPCCHVADYAVSEDPSSTKHYTQIQADIDDQDFNSLHHHSLGDILSGEWYQNRLPNIVNTVKWKSCEMICIKPAAKRNF
jgi:hypothetical protein